MPDTHPATCWHIARSFVVTAAFACLSLFGLTACSRPEPSPEPVRAVKLFTVEGAASSAPVQYAGVISARTESVLGFRVAGKLTHRPAQVGQRVAAGDLLAQMDATDYQLGVQAAQAQLRAASIERDVQRADVARYRELRAQNFISAAELDRREAALKAAQAQVEQAQAQLRADGNQAAYTRLLATESGVITATLADVGQVVAAGTPVVRVAADGPRDVVFAVPEQRLALISTGQRVQVLQPGGPANYSAVVREIAASADAATRTFTVKAQLETHAPHAVNQAATATTTATADPPAPALGATVTVQWSPDAQTANRTGASGAEAASSTRMLRIPTSALFRHMGDSGSANAANAASSAQSANADSASASASASAHAATEGSAVWVWDAASSTVRLRPVEVVNAQGNDALIGKGLEPGEKVVSAGVHVLSDGQQVSVYKDEGAQ